MSKIKIIPLGGVRETGKNIYVVEIKDSIFVLDCGLVYPEEELLGIDAVIPDFTYLTENADRVQGIFISHGHADAVGALPYLLESLDVPVFGTELTIELAKVSAKTRGLEASLENFYVIDEDTEIEFSDATISFFKTTHNLPDSVGIVVESDQGNIVYTGDFKFDLSVVPSYRTDLGRLADIGEEGVLALLSDSASAKNSRPSVSESKVSQEMASVFDRTQGRIIVACIGSNIARIQQILEAAHATHRKVFFTGKELYQIIDVAIRLDKLEIPSKDTLQSLSDLDKFAENEILIIETGDAGEPIKALQRMARGHHPSVNLHENDLVYIATTPSISFETTMAQTKDLIYRAGARYASINDHLNVTGHATPEDLKLMLNLVQPKYVIPINGESSDLAAHKEIALELGYQEEEILMPSIGQVIELDENKLTVTGQVPAGDVLVDGIGVGDIGNVVLRDRRILSEDGIFIVVATISRRLKKILVGPQITSRGFVYMKTSTDLIEVCSDITLDVLEEYLNSKEFDWNELKNDLREKIGKYLFKETKRRPVILPIIMEASSYQPTNK